LIEKTTEALQKLSQSQPRKIPVERMQEYANTIAILCKEKRYKEAVAQMKSMMAEMNYVPSIQELIQLAQQWKIEITNELITELSKEFTLGLTGLPILK
jgi:alanine-alpha-ketoisovalerate/valine-pyruvate aminotransferase